MHVEMYTRSKVKGGGACSVTLLLLVCRRAFADAFHAARGLLLHKRSRLHFLRDVAIQKRKQLGWQKKADPTLRLADVPRGAEVDSKPIILPVVVQ